jgi:hypothetical protein
MLAGAFLGGVLDEKGGEGVTVAGEELDAAKEAFLEMRVGIEGEHDGVGVFAEGGLLLELEVGGQAAEAVHLVAHLVSRGLGGARKVCTHGGHVGGERGEFGVHGVAGGGELAFGFDGHGAGTEAEGEGFWGFGFEDLGQADFVLGHDGGDGRVDEGGGEARKDGGYAA